MSTHYITFNSFADSRASVVTALTIHTNLPFNSFADSSRVYYSWDEALDSVIFQFLCGFEWIEIIRFKPFFNKFTFNSFADSREVGEASGMTVERANFQFLCGFE